MYFIYEKVKVYNYNLYHNNIHKNIGKIIAEYEIDNSWNSNPKDRLFTPIKKFNGNSWIFDPTNINILKGVKKLQEKYPYSNINVCNKDTYPFNSYVVIRNTYDKIYIYLDNPADDNYLW
jgi:hypothetical protein